MLHYQKVQKYIIHEEIYKNREMLTSSKRDLGIQTGEKLGGRTTVMSELLLHSDHHGRIRCAVWSATERSQWSRLQDLDIRIQGCQMQPVSTYDEASWRAQAVTRVHDQVRWLNIQVQIMTSNIKEMTVNLRSSKYMYVSKSESKNMHGKWYWEHRYT